MQEPADHTTCETGRRCWPAGLPIPKRGAFGHDPAQPSQISKLETPLWVGGLFFSEFQEVRVIRSENYG